MVTAACPWLSHHTGSPAAEVEHLHDSGVGWGYPAPPRPSASQQPCSPHPLGTTSFPRRPELGVTGTGSLAHLQLLDACYS